MYILRDYRTHSAKLNSYIIALLNKLAFCLKYAPLMFHLSYFLLFDEILNDGSMAKDKHFQIVRKFAQKVVRSFFVRAQTNPVIFSEILFFKTTEAVHDVNEPGIVRQRILEKEERESRRNRLRQRNAAKDGEDNDHDDDFEDEEEYKQLDIDMTPWTEAEDELLRNHYSSFSQQANVGNVLHDFLEKELRSTRSVAQVLLC